MSAVGAGCICLKGWKSVVIIHELTLRWQPLWANFLFAIRLMSTETLNHPIGKSSPRKEGPKKVTGRALYVDDLSFPDMIHGVTVRSPVARGKIKNIFFEGDIPW